MIQNSMIEPRRDEIRVSVIVPAFNVEPFIEQCLQSLFDQTVERLEIIVVDDGSTDRTSEVVESLTPPEGKSLNLLSKPNGGLSSARNAGLRAARGRWIGFVDADDWVAPTMFSHLVSEAENAGTDLAIARNVRVDEATGAQMPSLDIFAWNLFIAAHGRRARPRECPDLFALDHSPCKRVYRRAFLERIRFAFAEGLIFEDLISSYQILCRVDSVALVDEALYFYRVGRAGQIIGRKDRSILDAVPAWNIIVDELWNYSASAELWANFICGQGWLLLSLTLQIPDQHRQALVAGAAGLSRRFPGLGLIRFFEKFQRDSTLTTGVKLQLYGNVELFIEFAQSRVASERVKRVVDSNALRLFFFLRALLTSRLTRRSSRAHGEVRKMRDISSEGAETRATSGKRGEAA